MGDGWETLFRLVFRRIGAKISAFRILNSRPGSDKGFPGDAANNAAKGDGKRFHSRELPAAPE